MVPLLLNLPTLTCKESSPRSRVVARKHTPQPMLWTRRLNHLTTAQSLIDPTTYYFDSTRLARTLRLSQIAQHHHCLSARPMTSFYADGPARPTSPLPPPPTTWEGMLVISSLQGHLIDLLYTNEVAGLGALSRRCKASFLAPSLLRSSIQATGPSDATRFQFWKKALRVTEVQHQLLFSCDTGGDGEEEEDWDLLDKAGFEVFRSVLFSSARGRAHGAGEEEIKEVGGTDDSNNEPREKDAACEESLNSCLQQQRYSGKRMLAQDGQEGEILRDVARTFPREPLFRDSAGVGQNLLANVLKACLSFHDDTG